MVLLGLIWLVLVIIELVRGLTDWMRVASDAIWFIFVAEFAIRFSVAPQKAAFLRRNWLTLISLGLPALRILRFARALRLLRVTRSLRLVRLLTSLNRGFRSLGQAMQRRGAGYIGALTVLMTLAGAAGMLAFEGGSPGGAFTGYGEALWWTAMIVTTLGSDYWPQTTEGRLLTLLLSIYAVGVFGYLAASLASYFVGQESKEKSGAVDPETLTQLRAEIARLREELQARSRD